MGSNILGSIYNTTISAEKYIVITSQNIELSGNVIMKKQVTISNGLLNTNSLIPNVPNSASLGNTGKIWSNAYINDVSINNNLQVLGNVYISGNLEASNIYTKSQFDNSYANVYTRRAIDLSFANVYTRGYIDQSFANVYTRGIIDSSFQNVYTRAQVDLSFANVYTRRQVDTSFANVYTRGAIDQSFANVYTRGQIDNSFANVYTISRVDLSFANVYTRGYIDQSFANVYTRGVIDTSFTNVYTRIQVDNSFVTKRVVELSLNALPASSGGGGSSSSIVLTSISNDLVPLTTNTYNLGSTSKYWNNAYINNLRASNRVYQEISGDINWSAVNGYYGLAKDAYPGLNPLSNGVKAVQTWKVIYSPLESNFYFYRNCWSPELRIFVFIYGSSIAISSNGTSWSLIANTLQNTTDSYWTNICWSPQLKIFLACAFNHDTTKVSLMRSSDGVIWSDSTFTHSPASQATAHAWQDVCWSPELGIFVAVGCSRTGHPSNLQAAYIASSSDGINWQPLYLGYLIELRAVCWSPQLRIFVAVGPLVILYSINGTTWIDPGLNVNYLYRRYNDICWSPELGIFVVCDETQYIPLNYSIDGINWLSANIPTSLSYTYPMCIVWSPQLGIFFITCNDDFQLISKDGINWEAIAVSPMAAGGPLVEWFSWSPELGIFCGGSGSDIFLSSLKGRPPTSYNLFDSSFNSIDETGKWTFQNMAVTTLNVTGTFTNSSDDRLKHNEVVIANGLDVIDRLNPKFYQKTQVMLDASYNGDLSGQSWTYEAGLIAQEVLQIPDLSFAVNGGDYYQESYILKNQSNDPSNANYYDISSNYYDTSINYYDTSSNYINRANYDISYNLIAQPYSLNYTSIYVYVFAAIKELHAKVKAQETAIYNRQAIINNCITRIETLEQRNQV
jgi:hypothetical protein